MVYKFIIPTSAKKKTPSLNDYIKAERTVIRNAGGRILTKGAIMKKEWQKYINQCIRKSLSGVKITKPIVVHYHYYEPDRKRDYGNIHAPMQKFCEDSLQDTGVIPNDNQNYVVGFSADFHLDRLNPRVEVELEEVDENTRG